MVIKVLQNCLMSFLHKSMHVPIIIYKNVLPFIQFHYLRESNGLPKTFLEYKRKATNKKYKTIFFLYSSDLDLLRIVPKKTHSANHNCSPCLQ